MKHTLTATVLFLGAGLAQGPVDSSVPAANAAVRQRSASPITHVLHDESVLGEHWAMGLGWKASFGRDGFTFVPRLTGAETNHPFAMQVAALRVGGENVPVLRDAAPIVEGDRVTFARGTLREHYDLALQHVEQTFVVDAARGGDIELELHVATDLVEDVHTPGLQFRCEHGGVDYGAAFVVRGAERAPVETTFAHGTLRIVVPAALRGFGPVVIDPILTGANASMIGGVSNPDVAYDATNDRYLLVWEREFSPTDHDLFCELFDGNANPIPGSLVPLDVSGWNAITPRSANLDAADRFLVTFTFTDGLVGNRRMIWGRTRDAGGNTTVGAHVRLSDPNLPGDNLGSDVGADSGTGPGAHEWLVAWTNSVTINDSNIQGIMVDANGQPTTATVMDIDSAGTLFHGNVQVSKGNGAGYVVTPTWLVVYTRYFGATVAEVHGRYVRTNGFVSIDVPLDTSPQQNLFPQVSSPIRDGNEARFLVTYERPATASARSVCIGVGPGAGPSWTGSLPVDLTAQFGLVGQSITVESDGVRYAVANASTIAGNKMLSSYGWNGLLVAQGAIEQVFTTSSVSLASCRASGGGPGIYGAAFVNPTTIGPMPYLAIYGAYENGPMTSVVPTACGPMGIAMTGLPVLGGSVQFELSNFGSDVPGFLYGLPLPQPLPVCATCSVGVWLDGPVLAWLGSPALALILPTDLGLVGQEFAVQGFGIGAHACLGAFTLSDTVLFLAR